MIQWIQINLSQMDVAPECYKWINRISVQMELCVEHLDAKKMVSYIFT